MNGSDTTPQAIESISLDELPRHHPWPARLLDADGESRRRKTANEVFREYETDKWSALLARLAQGRFGLDEIDAMQFNGPQRIAFSRADELFLAPPLHARRLLASLIADCVHSLGGGTGSVVELGAGTGAVIARLALDSRFAGAQFHAGDFSPSSLQVMDHLARNEGVALTTGLYDFHAQDSTLHIPPGSVIFTSFAVAYVQGLDVGFWQRLMRFAPRAVVVAEPIYQHYRDASLLGLLRRRYCEFNDYNRSILPAIQEAERLGVLRLEAVSENVIGINPLCPVSMLVLRPTD